MTSYNLNLIINFFYLNSYTRPIKITNIINVKLIFIFLKLKKKKLKFFKEFLNYIDIIINSVKNCSQYLKGLIFLSQGK